jgi:SHAQKYF class myb-like DNA-binding protein
MFAVSRKPISITGKFVIKNDSKQGKEKAEEPSPQAAKEEGKPDSQPSHTSLYFSNKSEVKSFLCDNSENKETKRIKIRLSIIKDVPYCQKTNTQAEETNGEKKMVKKSKEIKTKQKRVNRDGNFNCGRWQPEEHQRFIEAIMRYGNEWKSVQRHVGTRSSTQARSHAQKFFVKIKKTNLLDLNMDLSKNSIKTLHEIANSMNADEYFNAIKTLNCVAFERKNNTKRKNKKAEEETLYEDSQFVSEATQIFNIK